MSIPQKLIMEFSARTETHREEFIRLRARDYFWCSLQTRVHSFTRKRALFPWRAHGRGNEGERSSAGQGRCPNSHGLVLEWRTLKNGEVFLLTNREPLTSSLREGLSNTCAKEKLRARPLEKVFKAFKDASIVHPFNNNWNSFQKGKIPPWPNSA